MDDLRRKCFFCSEEIEGKNSKEHIIPNSLLGKLGIKEPDYYWRAGNAI
jgi:hypothetical protein